MAGKSFKKPVARGTEKPITEFFARKPSLSLSPVQARMATRSTALATSRLVHAAPPTTSPSGVASRRETQLANHFDASMSLDEASSTRKPESSKRSQQLPPSTNNSKKRTRSPDPLSSIPIGAKKLTVNRTTGKRKSKFESDSEAEGTLEPVIHITKPPSPQVSSVSRKKPRLSLPGIPKSVSQAEDGLVPSSQSDEQELQPMFSPARDAWVVKESVDSWRNQMMVSPYTIPTQDIDVVICTPSPMTSIPTSPSSPSAEIGAERFTPESTTPNLESLPKTPIALDAATKTAQIIAQIKAKVYAESSPEELPFRDLPEELEDSSDEEDEFTTLQPQNKKAVNCTSYRSLSLRNNSPNTPVVNQEGNDDSFPPPSTTAGRPQRSRNPNRLPSIKKPLTASNAARKSGSVSNPLDTLLKEKSAADKRGKGDEAFRRAESALAGRNSLLKELQEEGGNSRWQDEEAARMAIIERNSLDSRISSPLAGESSVDLVLPEVDRLFGQKRGRAIEGIIKTDRANVRDAKSKERAPGVPLWGEGGHYIAPGDIPFPEIFGEHRVLASIKSSLERHDLLQATLLLDSGILATIELANHIDIISFLFQHAVSLQKTLFSDSAFRCLNNNNNWASRTSGTTNLPFYLISSTVLGLGAVSPALPMYRLQQHSTPYVPRLEERVDVLYRLITSIDSLARSHRLDKHESASFLMTLLLIGIEPSTPHELQCDVRSAINHICHGIMPGNEPAKEIESNICTIILAYLTTLEPVNQALAISFFSTGTHRTQRIARWLAHSIIVNRASIPCEIYSDLPSLLELLDELSRRRTSEFEATGKFELHEGANFVDMGLYTQILGIALSNIDGYIAQERKTKRTHALPPLSPSKSSSDKAETLVQIVRSTIQSLSSRISDTRAAHLDRSRTRAALDALSMRVHYQYMAATKGPSDGAVRPKQNIHQYFRPKN